MSLLPLAVAAALAAFAQDGASGYPEPEELKTEAQSYVDDLCAEHKKSCKEAKAVLKEYKRVLKKATACDAKACDGTDLIRLRFDLENNDEETGKLPKVKGRESNSLLRLSALIGKRIASANVRAGKPEDAQQYYGRTSGAEKVVEELCLEKQPECADMRALVADLKALSDELKACEKKPCGFDVLDGLVQRSEKEGGKTIGLQNEKVSTLPIYSLGSGARDRGVTLLAAFVDASLAEYAKENDAFEAALTKAEADDSVDVKSMPKDASKLMKRYQDTALAADRLSLLLMYDRDKASAKFQEVNAQTTRVSAIRGRILAVMTKRGLTLDPSTDDGFAAPAAGGGAGSGSSDVQNANAAVNATWKPTLLDARSVPPVAAANQPPPDILPASKSLFPQLEWIKKSITGTSIEQADAKRRLGQTTTIGSPGVYAPLVYGQATAKTCGIATQVQVLRAHGIINAPTKDEMRTNETALMDEAKAAGYFDEGTSPQMVGSMLQKKGLVVTKRFDAPFSDLESAIRRGHVLLVGVDARWLWTKNGISTVSTPHNILVTGAEIEKKTNAMLGVYINDSGDLPAQGGRFIETSLLSVAFDGSFAEVQ